MRKVLFLLLLLLSFNTYSQQVFHEYLRFYPVDTSEKVADNKSSFALLQGNYRFNSTGITNTFFLDFYTGDFITNDLKDQVSKRLNEKNRFGFQLNASVSSGVKMDSVTRFLVGVSSRRIVASVFSKDLFNLFFRGNKIFSGETADLDPFKYTSVDYQSLFVGVERDLIPEKLTVWGGASIIRGGNFREAEADIASLYTEADGAFIEATTKFNAAISDGTPGFVAKANGIGASVFLGADYKVGKSTIGFSVSDLGFISWKNLKTYTANGTYRFEGEEIANVLSFNDTLFTSYNADSLAEDVGIEIKNENKMYFLPTFFKVNYVYDYSRKLIFIAGLDFIVNAGYSPRVYVKPVYNILNNLFLHTTVSYGGYGKTDFEIGLAGKLTKGFTGYVNIFAVELLAIPDKTSGNGLSFALIKSF